MTTSSSSTFRRGERCPQSLSSLSESVSLSIGPERRRLPIAGVGERELVLPLWPMMGEADPAVSSVKLTGCTDDPLAVL